MEEVTVKRTKGDTALMAGGWGMRSLGKLDPLQKNLEWKKKSPAVEEAEQGFNISLSKSDNILGHRAGKKPKLMAGNT